MKKIALFFLAALPLAFFPSCESSEGDYETLETVKVVSSDLVFQREGGTGTVVIESDGKVTVESSRSWCGASLSGKTITVTVDEYDGIENRYADITITSGAYSTKVTVHQYGNYFLLPETDASYYISDDGGQVSIPVTHYNYLPEGVSEVDWLTYEYVDGYLVVKAAANETGKIRTGKIKFGTYSVGIEQWSFENVFYGEYSWSGTTTATGTKTDSMPVTFSDYDSEKNTFKITFNSLTDCSMVVPFDPDTKTFVIQAGQYVGQEVYKNQNCNIFTLVGTSDNYVGWGTDYSASFTLQEDSETGQYYAPLKDTGTWSGKSIISIQLELFTSMTPSSSSRLRIYTGKKLYNIVLYKK
jgi:hypothetical protein